MQLPEAYRNSRRILAETSTREETLEVCELVFCSGSLYYYVHCALWQCLADVRIPREIGFSKVAHRWCQNLTLDFWRGQVVLKST